jgi:hypothetical protein
MNSGRLMQEHGKEKDRRMEVMTGSLPEHLAEESVGKLSWGKFLRMKTC